MKTLRTVLVTSLAIFVAVSAFTFGSIALAAPSYTLQRTILPETDSTYELGTSTRRWLRVNADEVCIGTDCQTAFPGSSGGEANTGASLGTGLNIYDSKSGTTLRFNSIAAGTNVTISTTTNSNTLVISATGGSGGTGLATTTPISAGNLLVYTASGSGAAFGVATSTLSATAPLTGSFTQVGSGGSLGIQNAAADGSTKGAATFTASDFDAASGVISLDYTNGQKASGSQAGFLSSTDWTTFNNKLSSAITSIGPAGQLQTGATQTLASSTGSFNGLTIGTTITASGNTITFTPSLSGTLSNAGLANSTISGIALGSNLANLSATNSTLTFSGSYNGGTARTVGINLANPNTWTGLQQFSNASSTQLSVSGRLYIPTSTNPTVSVSGDLAVNTTTASSSLRYYDGTAERSLFPDGQGGLPFASSTLAYMGSYGAAGTTTLRYMRVYRPMTLLGLYCDTDQGTAYVSIGNGSATTTMQCTTASAFTTSSTAWTMGQFLYIGIGTIASSPNTITVSPVLRKDSD